MPKFRSAKPHLALERFVLIGETEAEAGKPRPATANRICPMHVRAVLVDPIPAFLQLLTETLLAKSDFGSRLLLDGVRQHRGSLGLAENAELLLQRKRGAKFCEVEWPGHATI